MLGIHSYYFLVTTSWYIVLRTDRDLEHITPLNLSYWLFRVGLLLASMCWLQIPWPFPAEKKRRVGSFRMVM